MGKKRGCLCVNDFFVCVCLKPCRAFRNTSGAPAQMENFSRLIRFARHVGAWKVPLLTVVSSTRKTDISLTALKQGRHIFTDRCIAEFTEIQCSDAYMEQLKTKLYLLLYLGGDTGVPGPQGRCQDSGRIRMLCSGRQGPGR